MAEGGQVFFDVAGNGKWQKIGVLSGDSGVSFIQGPDPSTLDGQELLAKLRGLMETPLPSMTLAGEVKAPVRMGGGFWRRIWEGKPEKCGCPNGGYACLGTADSEDRLCSGCRNPNSCNPDVKYRPPGEEP